MTTTMALPTVDARGQLCPKPLILARKALNQPEMSRGFDLLLDNETACENVTRYLADNGIQHEVVNGLGPITIKVGALGTDAAKTSSKENLATEPDIRPATDLKPAPDQRPAKAPSAHVICFRSLTMGEGSQELGRLLLQGFVNAIGEVEPKPSAIVMYNDGVKLAAMDSPVLEGLKALAHEGVEVLVCGTCVEYNGLKGKIGVGTISNMFAILERLSRAGHVVQP